MKRCVLIRADSRRGDIETARLLALELADRHVATVAELGDEEPGVIVFVASVPTPSMLAEIERTVNTYKCPILCCAKEGDEPLPTGVIRIDRPFSVARFCDSLALTVKEGKTEALLAPIAAGLPHLDRQSGKVSFRGETVLLTKTEATSLVMGGLFIIEALSVIIQVVSFKLTGKRVFKMAPIHHHFEKLGWDEGKVVLRFWIVSAAFATLGFALYFTLG